MHGSPPRCSANRPVSGHLTFFTPLFIIFIAIVTPFQKKSVRCSQPWKTAVSPEEIRSVNVTFTDPTWTCQISMLCLPLDFVSGFLFDINPERTKPEIKDNIICYLTFRDLHGNFVDLVFNPIQNHNQMCRISSWFRCWLNIIRTNYILITLHKEI